MRECYRAATLQPDGRNRKGRKTKHDTATRRWIDTVGRPSIAMGRIPPASDLAMMRLSPRTSLQGNDLNARDAWSQLHGRDPRSEQRTVTEKAQQQATLLAWARSNMSDALIPAVVRRGRVASWQLDFGVWKGFTPMQLTLAAAEAGCSAARKLPTEGRPAPGAYLTWITGQCDDKTNPFKWRFPAHFYLYLALRAAR